MLRLSTTRYTSNIVSAWIYVCMCIMCLICRFCWPSASRLGLWSSVVSKRDGLAVATSATDWLLLRLHGAQIIPDSGIMVCLLSVERFLARCLFGWGCCFCTSSSRHNKSPNPERNSCTCCGCLSSQLERVTLSRWAATREPCRHIISLWIGLDGKLIDPNCSSKPSLTREVQYDIL